MNTPDDIDALFQSIAPPDRADELLLFEYYWDHLAWKIWQRWQESLSLEGRTGANPALAKGERRRRGAAQRACRFFLAHLRSRVEAGKKKMLRDHSADMDAEMNAHPGLQQDHAMARTATPHCCRFFQWLVIEEEVKIRDFSASRSAELPDSLLLRSIMVRVTALEGDGPLPEAYTITTIPTDAN